MSKTIRDWDLAIAMHEAGKSDWAIAEAIGVSLSGFHSRLMMALLSRSRKAKAPASRTCLRCSCSFQSDGPGHRVCWNCKQSDDWSNPLFQSDNGITGVTQRGARFGAP